MSERVYWDYLHGGAHLGPFVKLWLNGPAARWQIHTLFDTGADYTCLSDQWLEILGLPAESCLPEELELADGSTVTGLLGFVDAELDERRFRLPVVFSNVFEFDLIGRIGLLDQFQIIHDAREGWTTFDWHGAHGVPWAEMEFAAFEVRMREVAPG